MVCCKWSSRFHTYYRRPFTHVLYDLATRPEYVTAHEGRSRGCDTGRWMVKKCNWVGWGNSIASLKNTSGYQIYPYVRLFLSTISSVNSPSIQVVWCDVSHEGLYILQWCDNPRWQHSSSLGHHKCWSRSYSQSQSVSQLMYECRNIMADATIFDGFGSRRCGMEKEWSTNTRSYPWISIVYYSVMVVTRVNSVVSSQSWSWIDVHQPGRFFALTNWKWSCSCFCWIMMYIWRTEFDGQQTCIWAGQYGQILRHKWCSASEVSIIITQRR